MENLNLHLTTASDFVLPNGFKIITNHDNSNPVICIQLYVKTGSVNESKITSGYSHFIEHLTFKTTKNFPDNKITEFVPRLGGIINAYTELDSTCYYLILPSEKYFQGISILSELAYKAEFTDNDIKIEKDIIIEEIKQYDNDPEAGFIDRIQSTYFISSPLKQQILGTKDSIKSATKKKLYRFYRRLYRPDNAFLVVSGSFDLELVQEAVTRLFSDWFYPKIQAKITNYLEAPECNGFRFNHRLCKKNGEYLAFILPELSERENLSLAQLVIIKAFASGKQSRLHKRMVDTDRSALEIRLHSISGVLNGITIIHIIPSSRDFINDIIYAFYDEWLKVRLEFFTVDEIELIRKELNYAWLYDFEYTEAIAGSLANEEIINSYKDLYNFPQKINKVDLNHFYQCLSKYWKADFISIYYQGKSRLTPSIINNIKKLYTQQLQPIIDLVSDNTLNFKFEFINNKHILGQHILKISEDFKHVKLINGMNLIMRKVFNKPTIGVAITSTLSQLCEKNKDFGLNFFTSGLLLFGTETKTYDEIQKECLLNGFSLSTSQTMETTTLKGKCLTFSLEPMLRLMSEIMQKPRFPRHYFNYIKSTVLDSIRREKSSPFNTAYNCWIKNLLGDETNLHKPYGSIVQNKKIKLEQLKEWYGFHFNFSEFTLSVAGDIDFDKIEDICNSCFTHTNLSARVPKHSYNYKTSEQILVSRKTDLDQSNIIIGGFGIPSSDVSANTAFYLLSQVVGGDLSSRFFTILREKYGFAYQSGFDVTSVKDMAYWFGYITSDKSDYKQAYNIMLDIFKDIRNNGISEDELVSARNYLKGMYRLDMESVSWQAMSLSILYALSFDYDYFMNREQRISSVIHEQVFEVADRCFAPENLYSLIER